MMKLRLKRKTWHLNIKRKIFRRRQTLFRGKCMRTISSHELISIRERTNARSSHRTTRWFTTGHPCAIASFRPGHKKLTGSVRHLLRTQLFTRCSWMINVQLVFIFRWYKRLTQVNWWRGEFPMFSQANWQKSEISKQGVEYVRFQSQLRANSESIGVVVAKCRTYDLLIVNSDEDDSGELGKHRSAASEPNIVVSYFGRSTTELKQSSDSWAIKIFPCAFYIFA